MFNQISKILPRSEWNKVTIEENNEELIEVIESKKLKIIELEKSYQPVYFVRMVVAEKLYKAAELLPENINLAFIEGYRSLKNQKDLWDAEFENLRELNPDWSNEKIEQQVRLVVARPHPLANHHCGGAVDVTLIHSDGTFLDMGSPYPDKGYNIEIQKKYPMFGIDLSKEQANNRTLLRSAMSDAGFVYYPGEWWHYCYGDRMWAVYTDQESCFYGPVDMEGGQDVKV
ncbi:MAG: M15 family metallopeptidase [Candidatus Pacebacteria bacterium]|nr:M15 family metallopeptidase [Candidatus Paceibacterota bacterium]